MFQNLKVAIEYLKVGGAKVQVTGHNKKYLWLYGEFEFGSYLFISY